MKHRKLSKTGKVIVAVVILAILAAVIYEAIILLERLVMKKRTKKV